VRLRLSVMLGLAVGISLFAAFRAGAAPTPSGVSYEEIDRLFIGAATPPPASSFAADYKALANGNAGLPKKKRGLLGTIMNANAGESAGEQIAASFGDTLAGLSQGRLERHSFYNNWERVDNVADESATIRKCDLHQIIELDLDKKTYRVIDTSPKAEAPDTARAAPATRRPAPASPAPGGGVLEIAHVVKALGSMLIDGINTLHFESANAIVLSQATGSCRNGPSSVNEIRYVSGYAQPHPICPVDFTAPARLYPREAEQMVARGGCRPTVTAHSSGAPEPTGKLSLYLFMTFAGNADAHAAPAASGSFSFFTERGNLHALGASDTSLFEIPSDYTKAP